LQCVMSFGPEPLLRNTAKPPVSQTENSCVQSLSRHCSKYKGADTRRGLIQLAVTLALYFSAIGTMMFCFSQGMLWPLFVLWLPTGGLLVRLFIVQHDCGHGSFFPSRRANDITGRLLSIFTFTPYGYWRDAHNKHHAGSGNLNRRGMGSIDTLTVTEYKALPLRRRISYRLYRNPFIILFLGPPLHIILLQRFPLGSNFAFFEEYRSLSFGQIWPSVLMLNIALAAFYGSFALLAGSVMTAVVFLPPVVVAAWTGGWLFFIQHQFEDTYWERTGDWDFHEASVLGSSYYALHPVLQWFTGNIGLHHIHHLCSTIPNYRLQECLNGSPELQQMNRMSFRDSLKCARFALWDETQKKLIGFRDLKSVSA
jgi:acyl-lipid omega-6 desaturase (Delta-12 desaturase)